MSWPPGGGIGESRSCPRLREVLEAERAAIDDPDEYRRQAARLHQELVRACGNETLILLAGALESLWSAHARSRASTGSWSRPVTRANRARYVESHAGVVDAIESGEGGLARERCAAHLKKATRHTLTDDEQIGVDASLLLGI